MSQASMCQRRRMGLTPTPCMGGMGSLYTLQAPASSSAPFVMKIKRDVARTRVLPVSFDRIRPDRGVFLLVSRLVVSRGRFLRAPISRRTPGPPCARNNKTTFDRRCPGPDVARSVSLPSSHVHQKYLLSSRDVAAAKVPLNWNSML